MRLHRLISILMTIENKGKITAADLAEQMETSVRTIYRDIDALCEAGIPLVAEPGVKGGISLMEGYRVGIKQLQQDDIIYLYLNGIGIKADRNSDIAAKSSSSLLKLQKLLPKENADTFHTIVNRFYVDESPWWGSQNTLANIDTVIKALWQSSKLDITYIKIDGTSSQRIIRPYGIAVKNNEWYLVAFCESSNALRTFKCERIAGSRLLSGTFLIPESFSLKDYFKESVLNFRSDRTSHEQYPVTVRMPRGNAHLLKNCEVYSSSVTESILEAEINMYSYECALQDFWNIICNASAIVSPDEVREAVMARLKQLLDECVL